MRDIAASLDHAGGPKVVVMDSVQTAYLDNIDAAPGTISQVRAAAQELIRLAKRRGFTLFLVGHVTKEGMIAGPRVLEHMVDTVLYFEGDRGHQFRILRAVKNRYGPTDEIGVFAMTDHGLAEVSNPSALFLAERQAPISGTAVFAGMEGTRPVLVEIEALVAPSLLGTPRRAVVGWDSNRLAMLLAVLEARCGVAIGARDVYLNVAGGLRITEPAADLAAAAALLSALSHEPVADKTVIFGEIGLSGEVRPVGQSEARLREAAKLGFLNAYAPPRQGGEAILRIAEVRHVRQLVERFMERSRRTRHRAAGKASGNMNTLDIIVAVVLVLSAGFAYMRGFVRELLAIVAWVGAAVITFYGYIYIAPFAERFVPKGPLANISAGAVVFIVALIVLSIITGTVVETGSPERHVLRSTGCSVCCSAWCAGRSW